MLESLLQRLRAGDLSGLQGTNLAIELPVSARLFQQLLDARPSGSPLQRLSVRLLSKNRAILHLVADVPVLGRISRELSLRLSGEYDRQLGGHIAFDIVDGLKLFDKPVINLLQGQVESKLPAGIDLNAKQITIDPAKLFPAIGLGYLLGLLAAGKLETRTDELVIFLHLTA